MSIHLKAGAPAFSPNNMRLGIKGGRQYNTKNNWKEKEAEKKDFSNKIQKYLHFYTVTLQEQNHRVNYHWHI